MKRAIFSVGLGLSISVAAAAQQIQLQPRMGDPLPDLTSAQLARFFTGKTEGFDHIFSNAEGLGPIMNDTACSGCHLGPASGGGSGKFVTRFGIAGADCNSFDPLDGTGLSGLDLGGSLLQALSINTPTCDELVPVQATVEIHRVTPPTFGFGLVEAIYDGDIQYLEAFPPKPWISGKVHMIQPAEGPVGLRAGRFGWKAQEATVMSFSSGASKNEQGITNDFNMTENAPNGDAAKLALCDTVSEPEDVADGFGFRRIDRMTDFQRFLAPPPQTPRSGMSGEAIFGTIGCADCHVATPYVTQTVGEAALSNKSIKPYSDFLLHDIGTGDGVVQGGASGCEFRTSPLWGLRVRVSNGLLHDGRGYDTLNPTDENNIKSAINWHTGEGDPARIGFQNLSLGDQQKVLNFLRSFGQLEFDYEGDGDVDAVDWFFLEGAFTGPGSFLTADSPTAITDIDQDGDFDLVDFGYWQRANTN